MLQLAHPKIGGHSTSARLTKELQNCLGDPGAVVTTMIDLYKIPGDFPGRNEPRPSPQNRVRHLEEIWAGIGDRRFHPYLQLHEFEALVLTDLTVLAADYPARRTQLEELAERLGKEFHSPEDVNHLTPPSKRIAQVLPEYDKVADGVQVLARIGLPRLRERCRHFGDWCNFLETIGSSI